MGEKDINTSDEKMKQQTVEAVDTISSAVKAATKKFFDACVERTAEVFSEVFDNYTNKAKEKIADKGTDNDKKDDNVPE